MDYEYARAERGAEIRRNALQRKLWKVFVTILVIGGVGVLVSAVPHPVARAISIGIGFPILREVWK